MSATESDSPTPAPVRLWLIDASAYIFRAYHALPPLTRKSDGLPVGAVQGYCNMLWKLLQDMKGRDGPTHLVAVFDHSERTFRNEMYPQYKAQRPPAPEDLVPQFALVREATAAFGVPCVELAGYEADDLIATYACRAREAGGEAVIVSSDKDLMQLIGGGVVMYDPMKDRRLEEAAVFDKFGVTPDRVVDVQALIGDTSDNIPGAPGIGVKTAAQLILEYGDLDSLLARASEVKQNKRRETLIEFADQIRMSRDLVTLVCDLPLPAPVEEFAVRDPDPATLSAFLELMEFRSLSRRVGDGKAAAHDGSAFQPKSSLPGASGPLSAPVASPRHGPQPVSADVATQPFDPAAYDCVQTLEQLDAWIARASDAGIIGFDTETDALSATHAGLCGLSLAVGPNQACYIPLSHAHPEMAGAGGLDFGDTPDTRAPLQQIDAAEALARLKPLLEDPAVLKVGQNIKYDLAVMARHGVRVGPIADTMLISYVLEGGLHGHGMDELSRLHLGHEPIPFKSVCGTGKAQISFKHVPLEPATCYAAEDADVTLRLFTILYPRLAPAGLMTVYQTLERGMPTVLAQMELHGIRVDPARLKRLSHEFGLKMVELEARAHALAGRPFNVASPKQLGEILFGEMALPGGKKTAGGQWATDAAVLDELALSHELPRVLLDWRQLAKLKGTYTDALSAALDPGTDRVHTSYQLAAASTGRLASSDPNLQNIPIRTETGRQIRQAFIAAPGHVLISADYSQIELRLLAHIGDIPELKRAFKAGQDIHAATASEMFGVPVEDMPAETRRRAKAINFGIVYGISAFGLAAQLNIPREEAGAYIKTYFERFPGIRDYMEAIKAEVREAGYVSTVFGRRIHIPAIHSKSGAERQFGERAAINAPIQGAAADIIRRAMMRMPGALVEAGFGPGSGPDSGGGEVKMLLQVHDELIFEAPEGVADAAIAVIKTVMEGAGDPAVALSVPLVVDARAAGNWDEAH